MNRTAQEGSRANTCAGVKLLFNFALAQMTLMTLQVEESPGRLECQGHWMKTFAVPSVIHLRWVFLVDESCLHAWRIKEHKGLLLGAQKKERHSLRRFP